MPIIKLTQDFINKNLTCNTSRRIEYVNDDRSGLYVEVRATSNGVGTYYLRYKNINGKTCHQSLGRTTDISLAEVKVKARNLKAEIQLGADPRAEEKAKLAVVTMDTLFNDHYLPFVKPRKKSWDRDEELYRLRISGVFGTKRLNQITRQQVQSFHSSLLEEGLAAATANHHVKLIRRMLNLAVEWEMLEKNPASRIHMFFEDNQVERYMDDDQLAQLMHVLRTDRRRSVCLIAIFLLSTGARLNEVLSATWSQIDLKSKVWRIPASNSKSKRMRVVPLNDTGMEVVTSLDTLGKFDHLFINGKTKKPYVNIAKVWDELRGDAGLPHVRIHDLRHQYASFLVNAGYSLFTVQQILGHSDPAVTMRYSHLSVKALRDAASSASRAMGPGVSAAAG